MFFKSVRLFFCTMLLTLPMVACGGDTIYDDPVEFNTALSSVVCNRAHECQSSYPPEVAAVIPFAQIFGASIDQCNSNFTPPQAIVDAFRTAFDAGRVIYSAGNAETCYGEIEGSSCANFWAIGPTTPSCEGIFTGTVANGATCMISEECVSQFCSSTTGTCEIFTTTAQ